MTAAPRPLLFDWSDGKKHWSKKARPCVHCGGETNLRDYAGDPSHKVCAEKAAAKL